MSQRSLPGGPEEITAEWFTAIFRECALLTSGVVVDVQTDIIGQDRGFPGVIVRVQLQYADCEETPPSSVVIKLPMANRDSPSAYRAAQEKDATASRRYVERCGRELAFYQQIAPLVSLSVPRLYYGTVDTESGHVILVLEDLHLARQGDTLDGCSVQDVALLIEQLAQFHAQWWEDPRLETFSWLPRWGGDAHMAQQRYIQCLEPFLKQFGSRVPKHIREVMEALSTRYGAVRERLKQFPTTLIHADLHLDNVLFSSSIHQPGVSVIDWQSVARGRGVIDLALFLFGSLKTTTRRAVEDDLLRHYHQGLLAGGVTGYDFPQLMEDCQLVLLWLLGARVVWLGSLDRENLSGRELTLVDGSLTEESFAAFFDHNAGSLLE